MNIVLLLYSSSAVLNSSILMFLLGRNYELNSENC